MPTPTINNPGPIWVCDPAGNNNPYLKILGIHTIFAAINVAIEDMSGNVIIPATFDFSNDGVNWLLADIEGSFSELNFIRWNYVNGMWAAVMTYTYQIDGFGDHLQQQIGFTSVNGTSWQLQVNPPAGTTGTVSFSYDFTNNGFNFTWLQNSVPKSFFVSNPNPLSSGSPTLFGNIIIAPVMDPGQPAAADFPSDVLTNPLVNGLTAVRFNQGNTPDTFDYTMTTITDAIVNSGVVWPGASWITSNVLNPSNPSNSVWYSQVSQ